MMEARALALQLPAAEDANSIQVGLMRIQKALLDDTISAKKAGLLLYSMQLAITNVKQTTFGKATDDDLVADTVDEADAIRGKNQHLEPFTTQGSEDTERQESLQRMDAEEGGLGRDGFERMVMKPVFTRDIPGLAEYAKHFATEGTKGTERQEGLPQIGADERGARPLDEHGLTTMRVGSLAEGDMGQMHAKMG